MAQMTKTERLAREKLVNLMLEDSLDVVMDPRYVAGRVPEAWHTLERDLDVTEKKVKGTLYLDESVAKFYRAMGQGYQTRINRVLATWAQMRILNWLKDKEVRSARSQALLAEDANARLRGEDPPGLGWDG
ncbi:BrnA antitoxin family protein [Aestuariibius insulae]|uniref:BrnA antitoxin family protein n=1 Tax=Aestuariibius insulae TaxID=2058287 RepID=UPI00345E5512